MSSSKADEIIYEGRVERLAADMYLSHYHPNLIQQRQGFFYSSGNNRGFTALWELRGDKLYLVETRSPFGKEDDTVLPSYRLESSEPIFADWFSGVLKIDFGNRLEHGLGFGSVYERYIEIIMIDGVEQERREVDGAREHSWKKKCYEHKLLARQQHAKVSSKEQRLLMGYDENGEKLIKKEYTPYKIPWYLDREKAVEGMLTIFIIVVLLLAIYGAYDIVKTVIFE